jgi:hypothetical protein
MSTLLAHHLVEAQHVPVLVALFAAGFFVGWQVLSRWLGRGRAAPNTGGADTGREEHG